VAAAEGSVATTTLLLKHGALVNAADVDGQTPLHLAILAQRPDTAEALLASGAAPSSTQPAWVPRARPSYTHTHTHTHTHTRTHTLSHTLSLCL
jgi:ankyrin repeat protein